MAGDEHTYLKLIFCAHILNCLFLNNTVNEFYFLFVYRVELILLKNIFREEYK